MNKKLCELFNRLELSAGLFDYALTPDECSILVNYIDDLQQRIEKAIEYIEHYKPVAIEDKILEILKGKE